MLFADNAHVKYLENKVGNNTVYVQSMPDSKIQGSGTGFQMQAKSGKVVTITNAHVCELANDKGMILVEEKRHSKRLEILHHVSVSRGSCQKDTQKNWK